MKIPYRTRKALTRAGIVLLIAALCAGLVWLCWTVWLGRYIVYTRDGAALDFSLSQNFDGEPAVPPEKGEPVSIYYNEGDNAVSTSKELEKMNGYYVELSQLKGSIPQVREQILALPEDAAILVDVKNSQGGFYYSSSVRDTRSGAIDTAAMDELIKFLKQSGRYTIARFSALRDYEYARTNILEGITDRRGYVWMDNDHGYWLDPTRQKVVTYLVQTVNELRELGFNEVVLTDFDIPQEEHVIFSADRSKVLTDLASTLVTTCGSDTFCISFQKTREFTLPEGRCRLYAECGDATSAASMAASSGLADPSIFLVFLTENYDTRLEDFSVLHPLSSAH